MVLSQSCWKMHLCWTGFGSELHLFWMGNGLLLRCWVIWDAYAPTLLGEVHVFLQGLECFWSLVYMMIACAFYFSPFGLVVKVVTHFKAMLVVFFWAAEIDICMMFKGVIPSALIGCCSWVRVLRFFWDVFFVSLDGFRGLISLLNIPFFLVIFHLY